MKASRRVLFRLTIVEKCMPDGAPVGASGLTRVDSESTRNNSLKEFVPHGQWMNGCTWGGLSFHFALGFWPRGNINLQDQTAQRCARSAFGHDP